MNQVLFLGNAQTICAALWTMSAELALIIAICLLGAKESLESVIEIL